MLKKLFRKIFNKKIEPKCKHCRLFNKEDGICEVVILFEGERHNLDVEPDDDCVFEKEYEAINEEGKVEKFKLNVDQAKFWVEDKKGKKTNKDGSVKIEYSEGFFGEKDI